MDGIDQVAIARFRLPKLAFIAGFIVAFFWVSAGAAAALPVIPGAAGYGTDTPAGRGGKVYKVTSLEDTNTPGTLRYAINQTEPRTIIFEVSGTIEVNDYLDIANPYITIAGQTAPSPGIFLRGAAIRIMTHDVTLQHLRSAPGDEPGPVTPSNRDALSISSPAGSKAENIVIDHCTFTWTVDELFQTWGPAGNMTFRHVLAAEPLNDSIHIDEGAEEPGPHGFGPLFDNQPDSQITVVGSLFSHAEGRLPYAMASDYVQVNNVFYDRINTFNRLAAQRGVPTKNALVGNVFKNGPSLADWASERGVIEISNTFASGGEVYLEDNRLIGFDASSQTELVSNRSSLALDDVLSVEPPVWNDGLVAKPSEETFEWVLANAGARPADRLPYETRIVDNARNGTGRVIDGLADIGGWPAVASNERKLVIPKDPSSDNDGDGYTNLEEWLESYAAYVEGRGAEPPLIDPEDGEPEEEPEPVPVPSKNVTELTVDAAAAGAAGWEVKTKLQPGDLTYTDRAFRFETVPAIVAGSDWIMASNNAKTFTGYPLSSFRIAADSDVYLAFDDRMAVKPEWLLSEWTDTGEELTVASPSIITYSLYHRSFPAGSTVTLGNNGNTVNVLYIPIVKAIPAVGNAEATVTAPADGAVLPVRPGVISGSAVDPDSNNAAVTDVRVALMRQTDRRYWNADSRAFDSSSPVYSSAYEDYNPVDDTWSLDVSGVPFENGAYTVTAYVYDGAPGTPATGTFTVAEREPEDVDGNGVIDAADLLAVVRHLGATNGSPDWAEAEAADVNGDGKVDHKDVVLVATKIGESR